MTLKIVKSALYIEVTERLRSMIVNGALEPGSWIDEQKLAEQLGVSRTPFREAIRILASEGLLRIEPRRGCYVNELSENDLDEIFPLMAMLEGRCAFEAALRITDKDVSALDKLHQKLEKFAKQNRIDDYYATNREIHEAIQALAANRWLSHMVADLRRMLNLSRHRSLLVHGRIAESHAEHMAIFEAIKNKQAEQAESLMKNHINRQRDALEVLLNDRKISA
jgi:DNA-binding GntR family transcriptional regulator